MKKVKIKEVGVKSAFKTTIYITSIPLAIMMIVGVFATIIGVASRQEPVTAMMLPFIIMPFFMVLLYGLIGMLVALVYNKLSSKFGGLELNIIENNDGAIEDITINK